MNLDLDERLIPKGEYRKAQNILVTNSEDSDVGAIENVRGSELVSTGTLDLGSGVFDDGQCIGSFVDVAKQRIFWFITNFTSSNASSAINGIDRANSSEDENCRIVMRENTGSIHYLASGQFLNFTTTHHITGVNVIGDFLYWTDNYNQPRYINIEIGKSDASYYNCEEKISVAKVAPFIPIFLHKSNEASSNANKGDTYTLVTTDPTSNTQHTKSEYMREKFIRFAYRYKYSDNTYSIISPFTQNVFKPLNSGNIAFGSAAKTVAPEPIVSSSAQYIYTHNEVPIMQNAYDKVTMRIPIPTVSNNNGNLVVTEHETTPAYISATSYDNALKIDSIEILLREAGTGSIQIVDTIDLINTSGLNFGRYKQKRATGGGHYYRQTVEYIYLAKDPFKVLPEKQLVRVGDNAPVRAKAQEIVGSRLVYGNITLGYDLPRDEDNKKGIKFYVTSGPKGQNEQSYTADSVGHYFHNHEQYKYHNLKSRRTYQVGIVLVDRFGRTSPVIPSTYKVDNLSDTHTVDAVVESLAAKHSSSYSWSTTGFSYGQALSVEFSDSRIVEQSKTFNRLTRPNGWYSWRMVVKQVEQDYYNVYTVHPMVNWSSNDATTSFGDNSNVPMSGYRDQHIKGRFTTSTESRSWFSLTNDNINKVPRSIKSFNDDGRGFGEIDGVNRLVTNVNEGLSGSEVKLYPKVVQTSIEDSNNSGTFFNSVTGDIDQDYISVLSIGSAIDQGLSSLSNAKRDDGTTVQDSLYEDRPRPYSFLADNHKNPIVAEIPNLYNEPVNVEGEFKVSTIGVGTTGTNANGSDNININDAIRTTNNNFANMPFGYPKSKNKGLTVFETKPFESNIDIYYETSSCGLVRDLNEHCDFANQGPTNIAITPTFKVNSFLNATQADVLEEAKHSASYPHAQIGAFSATVYDPNSTGATVNSYEIISCANDFSDGNDLDKFSIAFQDDKSYVKISSAQTTAANANSFNLSTGGTVVRLPWKNIRNINSQTNNFVDTAADLPSAFDTDGFYRVVYYPIWSSTSNNNELIKTTKVIQVASNAIVAWSGTNLSNIPTNIKQDFMLRTATNFAFHNDASKDTYNLVIRATQSNNIAGNQAIKVNITNTAPTANNIGSIIVPSNTQPAPAGRNLTSSLTAVNGSADVSNRGFGLTAALSGSDANSFAIEQLLTSGQFRLNPSTTFNFASLFGSPSNGVYNTQPSLAWSVTDNGNLNSGPIATTIGFIGLQVVEVTGWFSSTSQSSACAERLQGTSATYYVIKHSASTVPSTTQLYEDNKIYTNATITQTLGAGWLIVDNASLQSIPYTVNSSGVVTQVNSQCTI